ncbi:hypothetical protein Y032_0040g312 [Ancylostoma ceylanicum]|uniref:Uncharacterized protein n=1 Tax=Ancylostoma ceylanicum TaxID=53326 RepID=A0A016UJB5_9BILA|nr:hypothetical protein Y032_0040g312 [Ancylostoma ceylanicum]
MMTEAFERVLLDAANCNLTIEDEEDLEAGNDKIMNADWDILMNPELKAENFTFRNSYVHVDYISANDSAPIVVPFADNKGKDNCWKYEDPTRYKIFTTKIISLSFNA